MEMKTWDYWDSWLEQLLEKHMREPDPGMAGVEVLDVVIEDSYPFSKLAFIFKDARKPDCLFGFRWGDYWGGVAPDRLEDEEYIQGWLEGQVAMMWANFDEARRFALPERCSSDEITWFD